MSEENLQLARRLYPGRIDMVTVLENPENLAALDSFVAPDFELVDVGEALPLAGVEGVDKSGRGIARGLPAFVSAWRDWLEAWESWIATPTEFIDVDEDRVLVLLDIQGRSKSHGVEVPIEGANLVTFRERQVTRLELFFSHAQAFEAAGLSEDG